MGTTTTRLAAEQHGQAVVVRVDGELDVSTAPPLREELRRLIRHDGAVGAPAVVVDLCGVTFIDSYALGLLVQCHKLARAHRRTFVLVSTSPRVEQLFRITGMRHVLPLHADLASALRGSGAALGTAPAPVPSPVPAPAQVPGSGGAAGGRG